jgi:SRSO17 transposase
MDAKELQRFRDQLKAFLADLFTLLGRSERRHWAGVYIRGLLLDGERKSIEPMANRLPDGNVQALQQFIGQSPWDPRPIRRRLAEKMARAMCPVKVWIIDDTGFPKKGIHSVGVARQYSGTLGRVGNCQVAVSLHMAIDDVCIPLNFALYLPKEWTDDPVRLARAGVPEGTVFKTKFELAFDLIDEVRDWDIPEGVVVIDSFYGKAQDVRQGLIDRGLSYVAEVSSKNSVIWPESAGKKKGASPKKAARVTVKEFALSLPPSKWKTIAWREGSRNRLKSRFAAVRVDIGVSHRKNAKAQPRQWLLVEWPFSEASPCKFWFSNLPPQTGLSRLVYLAKARWFVEQNYQQQKEELGLDHYEGRGWLGWQHHVTMNMIAFCFLMLQKLRLKKNTWPDPPGD